ncbi:MAG: Uma2 family endonuclease [Bacteroidota bacterium]
MQVAQFDRSKTWTVEDYLQLDEGLLTQLIEGTLVMSPAPAFIHQQVLRELFLQLNTILDSGELVFAPTDLYIDEKNVLQPDLMFIAADNCHIITSRGVEGAPDLVIEVLSPSNSFIDRNTKKRKCLSVGVKEYWLIDPVNRTLEVYKPADLDTPSLYVVESGAVSPTVFSNHSFEFADIFKFDKY